MLSLRTPANGPRLLGSFLSACSARRSCGPSRGAAQTCSRLRSVAEFRCRRARSQTMRQTPGSHVAYCSKESTSWSVDGATRRSIASAYAPRSASAKARTSAVSSARDAQPNGMRMPRRSTCAAYASACAGAPSWSHARASTAEGHAALRSMLGRGSQAVPGAPGGASGRRGAQIESAMFCTTSKSGRPRCRSRSAFQNTSAENALQVSSSLVEIRVSSQASAESARSSRKASCSKSPSHARIHSMSPTVWARRMASCSVARAAA